LKKTLLLADDSPTIQKVINLTFADEGIDVIAVSDGNAALQQLREMKPDLVMADVHMPGLNGYQICERLRQNAELRSVPVILLVGSFEPFDEEEAKRVGADDFLMKPFQSIRQLVSRVTALLEPPAPEETKEEEVSETEAPTESFEMPRSFTHSIEETTERSEVSSAADEIATSTETEPVPFQQAAEEEDDDLAAFDLEFERKFPDAAALSSENIDAASFTFTPQPYVPEPAYAESETAPESFAPSEPMEMSESPAPSLQEAPPAIEHESFSPKIFSRETTLTAIDSDISLSHPETVEEREEMSEAATPERIVDEDDEGREREIASSLEQESAPVLEIEEAKPWQNPYTSNFTLDIDSGPGELSTTEATETAAEPVTEPVAESFAGAAAESFAVPSFEPVADTPAEPAIEAADEKAIEPFVQSAPLPPQFTEASQYDFRSADAFDEDLDIKETFHGMAATELQMPVTASAPVTEASISADETQAVEQQTTPEAPISEAAMRDTPEMETAAPEASFERVIDDEGDEDEEPGSAAAAQADGFSGAAQLPQSAPSAQAAPEAVDAVAQRVFEQLSEKVVTELVRGIMPEIKDLIAREIAKDRE
jgi:CheY-like chemotaxis protein